MKNLLIMLFLFISMNTFSQPLTYTEIITVDSVNKSELYVRCRDWFNDNFKSSKNVLQINDKETGELSGKGNMDIQFIYHYLGERHCTTNVSFQINLYVKDSKFKYELTNFIDNGSSESLPMGLITVSNTTDYTYRGFSEKKINEMYLDIKQNVEIKAKLMIEDLKSKMLKKSKSSNW